MKTKLIRIITLASVVLVPVGCCAADGGEIWMKQCKKCHGEAGKGDTPMGKKFEIRDYTDAAVQASFSDEEAARAIKEGVTNEAGKKTMLAFGDKLSDEEIAAVVVHLRSLKGD